MNENGDTELSRRIEVKQNLDAVIEERTRHRDNAAASYKHYTDLRENSRQSWSNIMQSLDRAVLTRQERLDLQEKMNDFVLVVSADYQMSKLVPHWGNSDQPGESYYLRKYKVDIFGIVNESTKGEQCYLIGEECGNKNTDFTISLLNRYLNGFLSQHSWIRNVHICMDNSRITKSSWLLRYLQEISTDRNYSASYLVPGHTKFDPDQLFSRIAAGYKVMLY